MIKVDTIEQFKVKQYIEDNFEMDYIKVTLVDRYTIKVTDKNGDSMNFYLENDEVKYR